MIKMFRKPDYNYNFDLKTGYFERCGKTIYEDPEYCKYGPEILDIEISDICSQGCSHCYKSNTKDGTNMSFEIFAKIFKKFPKTLTQVAFGVGDIDANKDIWSIMQYCRVHEVIPNITINGSRMTKDYYDRLSLLCGAVAVSLYDYDTCYNAVQELTSRGMNQVNIHCLLSSETYQKCMKVLDDFKTDPRLSKMGSIVFLRLKPKGERNTFTQVSQDQFKVLVDKALETGVRFGFDSCSAPYFLKSIQGHPTYDQMNQMVDSCESTLFSYYLNVEGVGFPCSFSEGLEQFKGINMLEVKDFIEDVWNAEETKKFRNNVINSKDCNQCRNCTIYNLEK